MKQVGSSWIFSAPLTIVILAAVALILPCHAAADSGTGTSFSGNISWYGPGLEGQKTASGELFTMRKKTAAHRTLPFTTKVLIEDPKTGNTVLVKVNDRGPFVRSRVMDVSWAAAQELGTLSRGVVYVDCLIVEDRKQSQPQKTD